MTHKLIKATRDREGLQLGRELKWGIKQKGKKWYNIEVVTNTRSKQITLNMQVGFSCYLLFVYKAKKHNKQPQIKNLPTVALHITIHLIFCLKKKICYRCWLDQIMLASQMPCVACKVANLLIKKSLRSHASHVYILL